jgi:hypothetical protein
MVASAGEGAAKNTSAFVGRLRHLGASGYGPICMFKLDYTPLTPSITCTSIENYGQAQQPNSRNGSHKVIAPQVVSGVIGTYSTSMGHFKELGSLKLNFVWNVTRNVNPRYGNNPYYTLASGHGE